MIPLFRTALFCAVAFTVSGCDTSQGIGRLFATNASGADGPDEFAILPTKPLEMPDDLAALPEPEPGARNRVDPLPEQDAVAALGGRPERLDSPNTLPGEGALLAATQRRGTAANIRAVLAEEDADIRDRNGPRLLERWFGTDTYFRTYSDQTLEARNENERLRRRGVRTPSVPPPDDD